MFQVDPRLTARFLRGLPDVLEAFVWYEGARLVAEVTVVDEAVVSARVLQNECRSGLGPRNTPSAITLQRARLRAA